MIFSYLKLGLNDSPLLKPVLFYLELKVKIKKRIYSPSKNINHILL